MAASYSLAEGLIVGIEHLWPLAVLPIAIVGIGYLIFRRAGGTRSASTRSRRLLFASRLLLVTLLVFAAMGPYTVEVRETPGEPRVTLLTDESDSMGVYQNITQDLVSSIESTGVPVTVATVGSGAESRLGDGLVANLRENGTVVALSDGQVTEGRSLTAAGETARSLNATVGAIELTPNIRERAVSIAGPSTATVGLSTSFTVSLSGVQVSDGVPVEVRIDGETVETEQLRTNETLSVSHTFEERGPHRVTAVLEGQDIYDRNDEFYHSVRVVEKPDVLYVAQGEYPFEDYLSSLYNVTTAGAVPGDLDQYGAVVVQDVPARRLGNVSALQEYVIGGGGLAVVGGDDAYANGGYGESSLATMLPVRVGNATGGTTNIVLTIDISRSAREELSTQKAIALDVLDQLGDGNRVGVVAFGSQAYRVADIQELGPNRGEIADRIRRLESGGEGGVGTDIANGIQGADELLGDKQGTTILLSDGWGQNTQRAVVVAEQLGRSGKRIISVGTGQRVNVPEMTQIAQQTGGSYFGATERNRLRLLFGGSSRRFQGQNLTVVSPNTFITSGVTLTANPQRANQVSVKSGADFQVATSEGTPAIVSWRFGLGRVVSITSYGEDGSLDGLLAQPDSLVLTKSVNFAIGDPTRTQTGVTDIGNARVGSPTTLTYRGEDRPEMENVSFRQVGEETFIGEFVPEEAGYQEMLGTTYSVNYPVEYSRFGQSRALSSLVDATGGQMFTIGEGEEIARLAREQATQIRSVRQTWDWVVLIVTLLLFASEVIVRRLQVYRGRTTLESGLQ